MRGPHEQTKVFSKGTKSRAIKEKRSKGIPK